MILVYFTVGSTSSGSAFVIAQKLGDKTIFESISLWRQLLPLYFLIRFFNRISHTFVLFKDITLTWIKYLETWLRSDNMSCYYKYKEVNRSEPSSSVRGQCQNYRRKKSYKLDPWNKVHLGGWEVRIASNFFS